MFSGHQAGENKEACIHRSPRPNQEPLCPQECRPSSPIKGDSACKDVVPRDELAVVDLKRLPAGLYSLLVEHGVEMIPIPDDEIDSLGPNVLAVRPGVAVLLEGNPGTKAALEAAGVEVHEFAGGEVAVNGSGGPTCLTRPLLRA